MGQKGRIWRVLIAVAICLGAIPAPAIAAPNGLKVRNRRTQELAPDTYKKAIRETVYIESLIDEDGNPGKDLIATDIIRPKVPFKVPSIYEMSPYYQNIHGSGPVRLGRGREGEVKENDDGDQTPEFFPLFYDNYFVPRGYAFIAQDMPGTRNSEGCMTLGGDGELAAAKATMLWLNGKGKAYTYDELGLRQEVKATWSNGKAGMVGKSYDGTIANAAASMGLPGLKTIVPNGGISRWYDYMLNRGVQYAGNAATAPLFTYYIDQPPPDDQEARKLDYLRSAAGEYAACEAIGSEVNSRADNPAADYDAFWDERDYVRDPKERPDCVEPQHSVDCIDPQVFPSKAKAVKASVWIVHGSNDYNVKPNHWVQWWKALKKARVPRKLWLSQTGHVDPFDFRREAFVRELHKWFDYWLWGINNGIMREPRVDIERAADKWRTYKDWPLPGTRKMRLWLGPATKKRIGTLTRKQPPKGKSQTYTDTSPNESTMMSDPKEVKESRLLFLSRKLRRRVHMSGEVKINMSASVDRPDTNFTLLVVDYGMAKRVDYRGSAESGIRPLDKEDCWGQSTEQDNGCYFKTEKVVAPSEIEMVSPGWLDARHHQSLRENTPLTPGEKYKFKWSAFGDDYVFKRGHRIGIVLGGSDASYTIPDSQQDANITVDLRNTFVKFPVARGRKPLRKATR